MTFTAISLFSGGADGLSEAMIAAGIKVIAHVEIDPFCRKVLHKNHPDSLILEDVKTVGKHNLPYADVIFGGPPCQPFSTAGSLRGTDDDRHLWPEMYRVIRELRPAAVLFENVANAANMVFPLVRSDLESAGYALFGFIVPASAIGAPHERKRLWVVAYADQFKRWADSRFGERRQSIIEGHQDRRAVGNSHYAGLSFNRRCRSDSPKFTQPRDPGKISGVMGKSQSTKQEWRGNTWSGRNGSSNPNDDVRHAARSVQYDQQSVSGQVRGVIESGTANQIADRPNSLKPELGRTALRFSCRLDFGGRFPGFPTPLGMPQFDYEPPRTVRKGEIPHRAKRVAMLGNAVVPQQAYPFALAIKEFLEEGKIMQPLLLPAHCASGAQDRVHEAHAILAFVGFTRRAAAYRPVRVLPPHVPEVEPIPSKRTLFINHMEADIERAIMRGENDIRMIETVQAMCDGRAFDSIFLKGLLHEYAI